MIYVLFKNGTRVGDGFFAVSFERMDKNEVKLALWFLFIAGTFSFLRFLVSEELRSLWFTKLHYNLCMEICITCSNKVPSSSSSSSFYWASVANAPNVLQPYWLIAPPLDVPDLTAILFLWGPSGQRRRCLWTFLFSNIPTFTTSRLQEILAVKGETTWERNGRWILPENARLARNIQASFTCRKSTTWEKRLYFPSEGRRAALKNPTASAGFEPANLSSKDQHATSRPPKPLANKVTNWLHEQGLIFFFKLVEKFPALPNDLSKSEILCNVLWRVDFVRWEFVSLFAQPPGWRTTPCRLP